MSRSSEGTFVIKALLKEFMRRNPSVDELYDFIQDVIQMTRMLERDNDSKSEEYFIPNHVIEETMRLLQNRTKGINDEPA
jgi:hypothetical protein